MGSPIADQWIHATLLVENQGGATGTGFLVARLSEDGKTGRIYLITNKHVIHDDPEGRQSATHVILHHNVKGSSGVVGASTPWPIEQDDGGNWREHPDPDVDVLAIDVSDLTVVRKDLSARWVTYEAFLDEEKSATFEIDIGEELLVLGYPMGFKHATSNLPLVRDGIAATRLGEDLEEEIGSGVDRRTRRLRGFLIDGAVIPGSSGSPVVLKPSVGRFMGGGLQIGGTPQPFLLGIIAETRFAPIATPAGLIPAYAGLGLAFRAETIRETVELFYREQN